MRASEVVPDTRHDVEWSTVHAVVAGIAEVFTVEHVVQVDGRTQVLVCAAS